MLRRPNQQKSKVKHMARSADGWLSKLKPISAEK